MAKVTVFQSDIDRGSHSGFSCPVAIAVRRAFPLKHNIYVNQELTYVNDPYQDPYIKVPLPPEVLTFIQLYDANERFVEPFSFELELE